MSLTGSATTGSRGELSALESLRHRPTLGVEVGLGVLWTALLVVLSGANLAGGQGGAGAMWWCSVGMSAGASGARPLGSAGVPPVAMSAAYGLPMWAWMSAAMMLPAAMPAVRHVAVNSLAWRRRRAISEFLASYIGIWIVFGALILGLLSLWRPPRGDAVLAVTLAVAAAWQLTPPKRRALSACHRSKSLPPKGWRATAGALRFGMHNGGACLGSCWAMMLVMAVGTGGQLPLTIGITSIVLGEKLTSKPRRATRYAGGLLAAAALGVGGLALVG